MIEKLICVRIFSRPSSLDFQIKQI